MHIELQPGAIDAVCRQRMPGGAATAEQLKRWMAWRLGARPGLGHGADTTTREAMALWSAVVDSLVWQRDHQGAQLDAGRFAQALHLRDLERRAIDGDLVLQEYLRRAAGGEDGNAVLYRARHPYIACFIASILAGELDLQLGDLAARVSLRGSAAAPHWAWRRLVAAVACAALGAGSVALVVWSGHFPGFGPGVF